METKISKRLSRNASVKDWVRTSLMLAMCQLLCDLNHAMHTGIEDLNEVLTELAGILVTWKALGGALGLDNGSLEVIGSDNRDKAQDCMLETIVQWLHGNGHVATWKTLVDALNSPLVKKKELADRIKENIATDQN